MSHLSEFEPSLPTVKPSAKAENSYYHNLSFLKHLWKDLARGMEMWSSRFLSLASTEQGLRQHVLLTSPDGLWTREPAPMSFDCWNHRPEPSSRDQTTSESFTSWASVFIWESFWSLTKFTKHKFRATSKISMTWLKVTTEQISMVVYEEYFYSINAADPWRINLKIVEKRWLG